MGLIRVFRLSKVTLEYYMIPQHSLRSSGISWDISGYSGIGYSRILSSEIPDPEFTNITSYKIGGEEFSSPNFVSFSYFDKVWRKKGTK